jgi:hypothetical protein
VIAFVPGDHTAIWGSIGDQPVGLDSSRAWGTSFLTY